MSQESDTQNDSKPARLKLSKKSTSSSEAAETPKTEASVAEKPPVEAPTPEAPTAEAPTQPKKSSNTRPISFKKREEPTSEEKEEAQTPAPKKQIPLRKKKAKADPLLDPDIEIAFHETPKLKPKETSTETPEAQETQKKPLGLKKKAPAQEKEPESSAEAKTKSENPFKPKSSAIPAESPEPTEAPSSEPNQETSGGLNLKPTPMPADEDESEAPPPPLQPRDEEEETASGSGKKTLLVAFALLLILALMAGGAVMLILGGLNNEPEQPAIAQSTSTPEVQETSSTTDSGSTEVAASDNSPSALINQAKAAVDKVNSINSTFEAQLDEGISQAQPNQSVKATTPDLDLESLETIVADFPDETPPEPIRVVNVANQSVETERSVLQVGTTPQSGQSNTPGSGTAQQDPAQASTQLAKSIPKDPAVTAWVKGLKIPSHSETMQKITTNKTVYQKGDLVDEDLQMTLFHVTRKAIYFEDMRGAIYMKPMQ
ncbi:MAG: hypothetical protein ACPGN3_16870 [Opitutales bacterium]